MKKYVCGICGYIYDESQEKVKWDDLPNDWKCPLCGASKSDFQEMKEEKKIKKEMIKEAEEMKELTNAELSALCSNLSKGCEKQYMEEEASLFTKLALYFKDKSKNIPHDDFNTLLEKINEDLEENFPRANEKANESFDRGAKRALTWSEKVTKMLNSLLTRYEKEGNKMLENTNVYVCDICGFIYIGDVVPNVCPICKVPSLKILKVERN